MLKILLLENNIEICKNITNFIQTTNLNAKLYNISINELEAKSVLKNNDINLLLINIECCSENFFKFLIDNFHNKFEKSLILFSKSNFLSNFLYKYNFLIYKIIINIKNCKLIISELTELIKIKSNLSNDLLKNIDLNLEKLGYDFSYIGTIYLREVIFQIYNSNSFNYDLQNKIYPIISQKYDKSITNIKSGIFNATAHCYTYSKKALEEYLNMKLIEKPKTKEIIDVIIQHISIN